MSDNYKAIVAKVETLEPIPGADRILLATVAGEQVIVGKDLWKEGDVGIYFPISVLLSHDYMMNNALYRKNPDTGEAMGGYMEPDRRVRFIKMKGVGSRGIFMSITSLEYLGRGIPNLRIGQEFDELFGIKICERYTTAAVLPQNKNQKVGKARSKKYLNFYEIGDTGRLTNNLHRFKDGDVWVITEKLHGTSARTGNVELEQKPNLIDKVLSKFGYSKSKKFDVISGTRRTVIGENDRAGNDDYRQYYHAYFKPMLSPGMIVYYEIVGPGIMPNHNAQELKDVSQKYGKNIIYSYGATSGSYRAFVYKIVTHSVDGNVVVFSWDQLTEWCNKYDVNHVPVLDTIIYDEEHKKVLMTGLGMAADGDSILDNRHPREGIVIHTKYGPFKFKSDVFCQLEGIALNSTQYVDPEDTV